VSSVLNDPCLVLNRNWQPVTFLPVQTAIVTAMRDMASVLDTESYYLMSFDDWSVSGFSTERMIRTPTLQIPAPEVIVLKKYGERPPRKVSFSRPNLYKRDAFTCQYCGDALPGADLTIEHVVPRSRGGPTSWDNCVAACEACNSRKADQTPSEAGMKLRTTPSKPNWVPKISVPRGHSIRQSWEPFLLKEAVA
jgi:5-methylcytosine-specific restriction endonuclease McrA